MKRAVLYARVSGDDRRYATSGVDGQLDDWHIMISQLWGVIRFPYFSNQTADIFGGGSVQFFSSSNNVIRLRTALRMAYWYISSGVCWDVRAAIKRTSRIWLHNGGLAAIPKSRV